MYVAGAGVGVGGDRDERAEERDGPAERAATDRQPGRLQSAEGRGRKGRLDGRVAARSSARLTMAGTTAKATATTAGRKLGEEGEAVVAAAQMELDIRESVAKYRAPWLP